MCDKTVWSIKMLQRFFGFRRQCCLFIRCDTPRRAIETYLKGKYDIDRVGINSRKEW